MTSSQSKSESLLNPFKPGGMKTGSNSNLQFQDLFLRDHYGRLKQAHIVPAPIKPIIATGEAVSSLKEGVIYSSQMNSAIQVAQQHDSYHDPFIINSDYLNTASPQSRSFIDSPQAASGHMGALLPHCAFLKDTCVDSRIGMNWKSMITPGCLPLTTPILLDDDILEDDKKYTKSTPLRVRNFEDIDFDGSLDRQSGPPKELFSEIQLLRISQGFQILRSFDDKTLKNKSTNMEKVAMILAPYVTVLKMDEPKSNERTATVEVTTYTKQHTIPKNEGSKAYHFAFCGKYNEKYRAKGFTFLSRFRGRGFLNLSQTDNKILEMYENMRSIIDDSSGGPRNKWTWDHYSFRCRYVFIPEVRGTETNAESIANEEYCAQVKSEFAKLITNIVNDMSPVETRQAKTSANARERTKTMLKPDNSTRRERDQTELKRHTVSSSMLQHSMPTQSATGVASTAEDKTFDPVTVEDATSEQLDQLVATITRHITSYYAQPTLQDNSDQQVLTVFLACDIIQLLLSKSISRLAHEAKRLLAHLVAQRKLCPLRGDYKNHHVEMGIVYYFVPETRLDMDGEDDEFDDENNDDDCLHDYEQTDYQMIEVKIPFESSFTWRDETKRNKCPLHTVARIIPRSSSRKSHSNCRFSCCSHRPSRLIEWYQINYAPEYNPVKEAFSLQFQWLAASPLAILEKLSQWETKGKRGFNIFQCPETPFNVNWDAYRDWVRFTIDWDGDNCKSSFKTYFNFFLISMARSNEQSCGNILITTV